MNAAFFVAFGGPVLLGVIGWAVAYAIDPARRRDAIATDDDALNATLADAERATRHAAESIARVREQMAIGGRH